MSSAFFLKALQHTYRMEGRFSDVAQDAGGPTDFGISLRFLKSLPDLDGDLDGNGHVDEFDIKVMTPSDASTLYRKYFWDWYRLDEIQHERIAVKVFDLLVNMRSKQAVRIVQRGLRACNKAVLEDGLLGEKTFAAINALHNELNLVAAMRSEAWGHYRLIVAADSSQKIFLNGWKNRAYS